MPPPFSQPSSEVPPGVPAAIEPVSPYLTPGTPEGQEYARKVLRRHRQGKARKAERDLTAEKYLVHVDGENDGQYAEIVEGQAVIVPPRLGTTIRIQRNLLRPVVDNFVSHFTGNPIRVVAEVPPGRKARDKARVTTLLANHIVQHQELNAVLAEAMYVAAVYGHCPVHANWRLDFKADPYLPPGLPPESPGIRPGFVEVWAGDPWSTVYNRGATRNSLHSLSYERTLPLDQVRGSFGHVPGVEKLRGANDLPSASRFQRIVRNWQYLNQFRRASAIMQQSGASDDDEKLIALVAEEQAPGLDPNHPDGRLTVIAVSGRAETDHRGSGGATSGSEAVLLHDGPLPAGKFSLVRFYALHRYDDVLGKPYVSDLDDLQVEYNQVVTLREMRLAKYADPRLMAKSGSVEEDTLYAGPDEIMFVTSQDYPRYLDPPSMSTSDFDMAERSIEQMFFRIAGWQAASRGEGSAGDAAAKVIALSRADDTIFGPISLGFARSINELMQLCVGLYREFSDLPTMVQVAGEEFAYAVEPWVRAEDLPVEDPVFRVTSAFGATPEAMLQTLLNLTTTRGADGVPIMTVDEFWDRVPDPSLRPHRPNPTAIKRRRLNAVNKIIESLAEQSEQQYGDEVRKNQQMVVQLARIVEEQVFNLFPLSRTDDPMMSLDALDEVVHDTTSSVLARMVAEIRQARYFDWIAQIQARAGAGPAPGPAQSPPKQGTPRQISPGAPLPGAQSGNMSPGRLMQDVRSLTSAATAGA